MIVLFHISAALTSVLSTGFLYSSPSRYKLYQSLVLIGSTLLSGIYLVISSDSNLVGSCVSGIIYIAVVFSLVFAAAKKGFED